MKVPLIDLTDTTDEEDEEELPKLTTLINGKPTSSVDVKELRVADEQQPCTSRGLVPTPWNASPTKDNSNEKVTQKRCHQNLPNYYEHKNRRLKFKTIRTTSRSSSSSEEENDNPKNTPIIKCFKCNIAPSHPINPACNHTMCYSCFYINLVSMSSTTPKCSLENCEKIFVDDFIKGVLHPSDYIRFLEDHCKNLRLALAFKQNENSTNNNTTTSTSSNAKQEIDEPRYQMNFFVFECSICLMKIPANDGVILKNCSHTFCKACLSEWIRLSEDEIVHCPHRNEKNLPCESLIQEREIKGIVSKEIFDLHLKKGLRKAEIIMSNVFHCKTPDCDGFVIFDVEAKAFPCPVCDKINCLMCKAVHETKTCEQHKEDLLNDEKNLKELKMTEDTIKDMLIKRQAILCAQCNAVIQKYIGCDNVKCIICNLQMCWITGKPRQPLTKLINGYHLTIDGCHCKENGVMCHPACQGCH